MNLLNFPLFFSIPYHEIPKESLAGKDPPQRVGQGKEFRAKPERWQQAAGQGERTSISKQLIFHLLLKKKHKPPVGLAHWTFLESFSKK